jgi:hypothetical protein
MNRYALEMYARGKYSNLAAEASSWNSTMSTSPSRIGFLFRNVSQLNCYQPEPPGDNLMKFIYELRCDLIDDFEEVSL